MAVDFSPPSTVAFETAAALRRQLGATLDAVHVWNEQLYPGTEGVMVHVPPGVPHQSLASFLCGRAEAELRDFLRAMEAAGEPRVGGRFESGDPAWTLAEESADYDLLVLGTHGRTGWKHALLGSVAEKIVRTARCPVLTVRPPAVGGSPGDGH